ncbi:MAG: polysaccharide deacetylase family protein [Phycisphaerales bacterium]
MIATLAISAGLGVAGASGLVGYGIFHPRSQLFGRVITNGRREISSVALTFDDGPHPNGTPAILDRLAVRGVKAAFFVIGRHVQRWPELLARIDSEGHLIGCHSYEHAHGGMFGSAAYWRAELSRTMDAVSAVTGRCPAFLRPPMGFKSPHLMRAARAEDMFIITWSRRAFDSRKATPVSIVQRLQRAQPGDILALHDGHDPSARSVQRDLTATVAAIDPLVTALADGGLGCARLDDLIGLQPYTNHESTHE